MNIDASAAVRRLDAIVDVLIASLPNFALGALVFLLFYFFARIASSLVARATVRRGRARSAGVAVGRLARGLVVFIGLLLSLSVALPTFKPGDVVELLGISSVAVGFAFRDILQNFLAGILILFSQPFRIGDQIVSGDFEGTVEDVQTRATFIRTFDGRRIVIPNSSLFTSAVTVNTPSEKLRVEYDVGIGYGDDIERAKQLILQAIDAVPGILKEPAPDAIVMDLAPSAVSIRARWWTDRPLRADTLDTRDRVLAAIKNTLQRQGIDLPFPTQHVLFHDQTETTDGDRTRQREGWPARPGDVPAASGIAAALRSLVRAGPGSPQP